MEVGIHEWAVISTSLLMAFFLLIIHIICLGISVKFYMFSLHHILPFVILDSPWIALVSGSMESGRFPVSVAPGTQKRHLTREYGAQ